MEDGHNKLAVNNLETYTLLGNRFGNYWQLKGLPKMALHKVE